MFKLLVLFAAVIPPLIAETTSAFTLLEKHAELPDLKTEPVRTHAIFKKESKPEAHPVYRGEDQHQGRANIEPVRPRGPVIKYDPMLADQTSISTEGNRDNRITLVSYVGRTISWVFSSIFVLLLGSLITVGVCSYTNLCTIAFHGVGPIHEEMRALMTTERLEKIGNAADFVKTAIDKYQNIQKITDGNPARSRRAIVY
ncbi:Uncharacterized protein OBRU01_04187 [Operophtera brumata]|uniref:Uncharacterized protein n=1 Tax=Operophtera brumata TaxID=104452 RepID=A0A0L7LPP7_OPEBR|nr:Uncharacterized protein OBRU01_04187 [Operophtera brumata]